MAKPELKFENSKSVPLGTVAWKNIADILGDGFVVNAKNKRTVYIIRLSSPFAVQYQKGFSPVIYIGRGDFKKRLTSHVKKWLNLLEKGLKNGRFEILLLKPRASGNGDFYKDVEADLLRFFSEKFGETPLNNSRKEKHSRSHEYRQSDINRAFGVGKGSSYIWAIKPIGKNSHKSKVGK